jgi:hypothetical protein
MRCCTQQQTWTREQRSPSTSWAGRWIGSGRCTQLHSRCSVYVLCWLAVEHVLERQPSSAPAVRLLECLFCSFGVRAKFARCACTGPHDLACMPPLLYVYTGVWLHPDSQQLSLCRYTLPSMQIVLVLHLLPPAAAAAASPCIIGGFPSPSQCSTGVISPLYVCVLQCGCSAASRQAGSTRGALREALPLQQMYAGARPCTYGGALYSFQCLTGVPPPLYMSALQCGCSAACHQAGSP